jgi:HlyD family secretion protein
MKINNLILLLFLGTLFSSCSSSDNRSDAYGNFEATEIIVSAQANGQLLSFNLQEGDLLVKGQRVGIVDTTDLYLNKKLLKQKIKTIGSNLVSINSEIEVQKQQLQNNTISKTRVQKMYNQGAATKKQLDDINGLVDLNKKMILSIKSKKQNVLDQISGVGVQIEQIDEAISKCLIENPAKGTVMVKYAEQGEIIAMGKPLFKLADVDNIKLKAYISGAQLADVKLGDEVEVAFDKNNTENNFVNGKVIWISSTAEFTPKTIQTKEERVNLVYALKILVNNDGRIKVGMPGEVNFVTAK